MLINVDAKWSLAIRRLRTYWERRGAEVAMLDLGLTAYGGHPVRRVDVTGQDLVYISTIFEANRGAVVLTVADGRMPEVDCGGVGSSWPSKTLPPEVDECPPWYGEDEDTARGFITRGCIRRCPWCKVPGAEGSIRPYRDVADIVGDRRKAVFYDNNFLAWEGCIPAMRWLADQGIRVDFNQGLDFRLAEGERLEALAKLKRLGPVTFAFDDPAYRREWDRRIDAILEAFPHPWDVRLFLYQSPAMRTADLVMRIMWCRERRILPYVMRDRACQELAPAKVRYLTDLAAWCNQPNMLKKLNFPEFLAKRHPRDGRRRRQSGLQWGKDIWTIAREWTK